MFIPPPTPHEQLQQDNPVAYERYLLVAVDTNEAFWDQASKILCVKKDGSFVNNFENRKHYIIYRAIYRWRQLMKGQAFSQISEGGLISSLYNLTMETPPLLTEDQVSEFTRWYLELREKVYPNEAIAMVQPQWIRWIMSRKTKDILDVDRRSGLEDVQKTLGKIKDVSESVEGAVTKEKTLWTLGELLAKEEKVVERMPLGKDFKRINASLGGGLGKSEHIIAVCPTGGGKTVFACQLAVDLALAGREVLLITTEEAPEVLAPRFVSNLSYIMGTPIRFDLVEQGITAETKELLSSAQLETLARIPEKLKHLHIKDWTKSGGISQIQEHIEDVNAQLKEKKTKLDCVILDWIGGSIVKDIAKDNKTELRLRFIEAANAMKQAADTYNIAAVSTAQATPKSVGKAHITEQDIAECKSIHTEAVAAFGISAIRTNASENDEEADSYETRQYFNFFKTRKGKGKVFPVRRNFGYQRFEDM